MPPKIGLVVLGNAKTKGQEATSKFALWLSTTYVHLWIVEGALRKWLPGFEQVLYVARDGIIIFGLAWAGLFLERKTRRGPVFWVFSISVVLLATAQVMVGLVPIVAAIVGVRSYIAPCLFAYLIWCYAKPDIVPRIARLVAIYAPLQMGITVAQVSSPRTSWINKEVSSDVAHFANGLVVRASGSFSAPSGLSLYIPLCLALCLWMIHYCGGALNRILAILGIVSSSLVTVLSGARGTVLAFVVVLTAYLIYQLATLKGSGFRNALLIISASSAVGWSALQLLPTVFSSFLERFESASQAEDTSQRIAGQVFDFSLFPFSFFGNGIGNHSVSGMAVGGSGPWVENESLKWVAEMGALGWILASIRILLCVVVGMWIIVSLRQNRLLAVLLAACLIPVAMYGQITQFPSAQAAFSISMGLLLLVTSKTNILTHMQLRQRNYSVRPRESSGLPEPIPLQGKR